MVLKAVIVALAFAALTAVPAAGAAGHGCPPPGRGQGPKNDRSLPIGPTTARNMTCRAVHAAIRAGTVSFHGNCFGGPGGEPCHSSFKTPGFRCSAPKLGTFVCLARRRRFRFDWTE
jgi:hypothetical protein